MNEEEKQELEALRKEKQERVQQERAQKALAAAGVPISFAPLLAAADDNGTDQRTTEFCAAYQKALADEVRLRLPQEAPAMTPPPVRRPERGIRRIRHSGRA